MYHPEKTFLLFGKSQLGFLAITMVMMLNSNAPSTITDKFQNDSTELTQIIRLTIVLNRAWNIHDPYLDYEQSDDNPLKLHDRILIPLKANIKHVAEVDDYSGSAYGAASGEGAVRTNAAGLQEPVASSVVRTREAEVRTENNRDIVIFTINIRQQSIKHGSSTDTCDLLKSLVPCETVSERNLLADVAKIVDKNKICKRKDKISRKIVTDSLLASGYTVSICKSRWEKTSTYRAGN
ncbi:hypothetical protein L2E82_08733 [Cichorium intybus]|uniref:Uncharacterized protein n=1 Tax=Cichorium intybus TaxID=13427 RepID=A0ACB9G7H4_CICIN|nr:hypothetical protein L2E82_08733 [Cichorium intybus]